MTFWQATFTTLFAVLCLGILLPKFFIYDDPTITTEQRNCAWQGTMSMLNQGEKILLTLGTHKITGKTPGADDLSITINQDLFTPFDVKYASSEITCLKLNGALEVGSGSITRKNGTTTTKNVNIGY